MATSDPVTCPGCDEPLSILPAHILTGRERGKYHWSARCKNGDCPRDGVEPEESWKHERAKS